MFWVLLLSKPDLNKNKISYNNKINPLIAYPLANITRKPLIFDFNFFFFKSNIDWVRHFLYTRLYSLHWCNYGLTNLVVNFSYLAYRPYFQNNFLIFLE